MIIFEPAGLVIADQGDQQWIQYSLTKVLVYKQRLLFFLRYLLIYFELN